MSARAQELDPRLISNFHASAGIDRAMGFKGQETAENVVETTMRAIGTGRAKIVSGWTNWLVASAVNVLPNSLITRAMAKGMRGRFQDNK